MASYDSTISSPSDAGSEKSTLSEFVNKRFQGHTPVFGGNPITGVRDFASAAGNSASLATAAAAGYGYDIVAQVRQLTSAVQGLQKQMSVGEPSPITPRAVPPDFGPIMLVDNDRLQQDFEMASQLDGEKVQLLLSASFVNPTDISSYQAAIRIAQRSAGRKLAAMKEKEQRKQARMSTKMGLGWDHPSVNWSVDHVKLIAQSMGLPEDEKTLRHVALAFMHESFAGGVQTNRALAQLGDSVLRSTLLEKASQLQFNVPVSVLSDVIIVTQCGTYMHTRALELEFQKSIVAAPKVNVDTRDIMSAVVEALYGVAYLYDRMEAVEVADKYLGIVSAGLELLQSKLSDGKDFDLH